MAATSNEEMEEVSMKRTEEASAARAGSGRRLRGLGRRFRRAWWMPLAAAGVVAAAMLAPIPTKAAPPPSEGLVCTTNASASFVLTARTGYITTPDLNSMFMWSYAAGNGSFQYPGPYLCVNEGDSVTITLKNTLAVPTSIMFPGITGVHADGAPNQPDLSTNSLAKVAGANGGSVAYTFKAAKAGTYLYESGTDPQTQVRMGLVGALVVRPAGHPDYVYDPQPGYPATQFNPAHEYVHVLTEIDPDMHQAYEFGKPFDLTQYKARYFMINGRSFPDTIAPNFSSHLPAQPYGSLVHVTPRNAQNPLPAVVRYLNGGPVDYPFHPHSNHERIVGTDANQLVNPNLVDASANVADTSADHFGIVVPPGQTQEGFFTWQDAQNWDPSTNPVGVQVPSIQNRTEGAYWSGSPYLGVLNPTELTGAGKAHFNQCGEFYHVAHSHALFQATNYGLQTGTGMLTMIRVDPVDPNNPGQPRPDCVG
jgi:FtsP/CotA-like multicopper oxidase with cupredoxin domain